MIGRGVTVLVAALLVASGLAAVSAQHRARTLFIDLERAQQQGKALEAEGNRLRIELGRAAQPATVEAAARALGLRPVDAARTVFLPAAPGTAQEGTAQ
jgi:cell division protein FtsL